jgi:hypothetical protein
MGNLIEVRAICLDRQLQDSRILFRRFQERIDLVEARERNDLVEQQEI